MGGLFGGGCFGASGAGAELHSHPMTVAGAIELEIVRDPLRAYVALIVLEFRWQGINDDEVVSGFPEKLRLIRRNSTTIYGLKPQTGLAPCRVFGQTHNPTSPPRDALNVGRTRISEVSP